MAAHDGVLDEGDRPALRDLMIPGPKPTRAGRAAALLLAALVLSGCASAVAEVGGMSAERQARNVQIFVASTRPAAAPRVAGGPAPR